MLNRLKNVLGVEGVSLALEVKPEFDLGSGRLGGALVISTLRPQTVRTLSLRLTERYTRGRGEHRRIDDYLLGELELDRSIDLKAGERVAVPFVLRFAARPSRLEEQLAAMPLLGSIVRRAAHLANGVQSVYTLTALASVAGVALDPVCAVQLDAE